MYRFVFPLLLFLALFPTSALAATLSVSPAGGTYTVGQRVIISVAVSSDASMNAASGVLSFPTDLLSVEYVNKGSVLNFWVTEPSYSNASGRINFEGVSLSGFQGSNGSVLTVALRAKKAGTAQISFESGQVLANDGQGTDITSGLKNGTYTFEVGKVAPKPEPEPELEPEPTPTPQKPATPAFLEAPIIRLGLRYGADAILGESKYPKTDVVLSFVSVSGSKIFISGVTDSDGDFELSVPTALRNGSYAVTATVVFDDGRQTETSEPLSVQIGGPLGFLNWEYTTYVALFCIFVLVGLVGYFLKRGYFGRSLSEAVMRREAREAENMVHRSFDLLRQDVSGHIKSGSRKTPQGEKTDVMGIKKDLDEAEDLIAKEIKDITSTSTRGDT